MPWVPELFTAPALQQILDKRRRDELVAVPYFDGLLAGEPDALVESFAGEPELHDPVRGRVKGDGRSGRSSPRRSAWLRQHNAVGRGRRARHPRAARLRGGGPPPRRRRRPASICRSRSSPTARSDGRIDELRVYFSDRPLTGRHANRPPLLQPDPELDASDVVADVPARARGRRRRRDRRGLRTGRLRPRACGRPVHPQRSGRPARLLRAHVLQRRRHPAGDLRPRRRRARVRPGVQRRAAGQRRSCRRRPGSPSSSGAERQARRGPRVRRRRIRRSVAARSATAVAADGGQEPVACAAACGSSRGRASGRPRPRPRAARGC